MIPAKAPSISFKEFIAMSAMILSLIALSIDAILPALPYITEDLGLDHPNRAQLLVTMLFLGMGFGQVLFGPLSDSIGRKKAAYYGFCMFFIGSIIAIVTDDFKILILGRILQGVGLGGPRTVNIAIVRDQYSGDQMAKVMSYIMAIFILAPTVAPAIGQVVLHFGHWRWIFVLILILSVGTLTWFATRQQETLEMEHRRPFSLSGISKGIVLCWKEPSTRGYTLAQGFIMGGFLGYLSSVQQILQIHYKLGTLFPVAFACFAIFVGAASLLNGHLVKRMGMAKLCRIAISFLVLNSAVFLSIAYLVEVEPHISVVAAYFAGTLFCFGILMGNLNSLAMEPLGRMAGLGAAVIGFIATIMSVPIGAGIGYLYNNSAIPVATGFGSLGLVAAIIIFRLSSKEVRRIKNSA